MLPVGLEPTASELEVRRAAIAPRELDTSINNYGKDPNCKIEIFGRSNHCR